MAFVDDFIANLAKDFRQIPNQTSGNLNSVASGIAGALISNGLTPLQLILAAQQTLIGFISGETANDFPGRVNALAGLTIALAPLAGYTATFGEVNVGILLYEAGFAVSGSAVLATASTLLIPIAAGLIVGTVAQAYAETLQSYSNGGAGYQLTTLTEQAGFSLIGMQYDADLALASTPDANAVSSIITPGSVLTINFDPSLWKSTYGGNPPEGYAANDITGRTVLIQGILGSLVGSDGSEFQSLIQGALDPVVTEILVANVSGVAISDAGVAAAFGKSYGEALILGNTAGSILTPTGNTFDAFIAQGQSNTIDFTSSTANGSGANLVELVNGGTLTIQAADRADCTVVWDTSSKGTIALNAADNTSVNVIEVDVPDVSMANFLAMSTAQLDAMFGTAIVIINPTASEHITFNGVQLTTPTVVNTPNPNYNPDLRNPGEPNANLTPYYVHWLAGGLEYFAGSTDSLPGDSYVSVSRDSDLNAPTLTLNGFANGDFGFSVPSSLVTFNLFTGAQGTVPTVMNGHVQLHAADFLTTAAKLSVNAASSPSSFGGVDTGTVDPSTGVTSLYGLVTAVNTYSWLSSFVSLTTGDFNEPDGTFTFDTTSGRWSFTLDTSSAHYLSLAPGETAKDTLTVHTLDGSVDTITVTVVGGGNGSDTVDQFLANQAQIDQLNVQVTITDTGANISAAFDALNGDTHVTSITIGGAGSQVLTLTVAQATGDTRALGLITNAGYQIVIADTAAHVAAALPQLASNPHITSITLTDPGTPTLSLGVAQALGALTQLALISSPHTLTISDIAAHIASFTPAQIASVAADGLTYLIATDAVVSFSLAQKQALGAANISLIEPYPYAGASRQVLTYYPSGALREAIYLGVTGQAWDTVDSVYAASGALQSTTWSKAGVPVQSQSLNADGSLHDRQYFSANGQVETISFANGVQSEILFTGIAGQPWDRTDTLYGANGKPLSETWTTAGALYKAETWNGDGSVHDIHFYQAGQTNGAPYTDYDVLYGANGKEALRTYYTNGVAGEVITESYTASGTLSEALYTHVPNATYDTADYLYAPSGLLATLIETKGGTLVLEQNYRADGSVAARIYGPSAGYSLLEYDYNATGSVQVVKNQTNLDGTHTITGLADGQRLASTIGVADTLTGGGASETFVFGTAFGHDTVTDLATHLSGLGADTLQFSASAFSYLNGGMSQAQEVAALLAHATQDAGGAAVIADSAGDSVALKGVSLAALTANAGVIKVV